MNSTLNVAMIRMDLHGADVRQFRVTPDVQVLSSEYDSGLKGSSEMAILLPDPVWVPPTMCQQQTIDRDRHGPGEPTA